MDAVIHQRDELEIMIVAAHVEAGEAWKAGATEAQMKEILHEIRHAQFRWDYAAAAHGAAFHNSLETLRVIATGMKDAQDARLKLAQLLVELGADYPVPYPDIETKAKAQEYIGLPMDKLEAEKQRFLKSLVPEWDKKAKAREAKMEVKLYD
jgi:nitrite reductase (cytochrome c-552)